MRVLLACDKFKGSLSGAEVNRILAETWLRLVPDCDVDCCPIADGGEGTTQAVVIARGGRIASVPSLNALDEPIESEIGLLPPLDGQPDAVAEMSSASGLAMLAGRRLEPLRANTRGTGLLMMAARNMGAGHLLLGIGGSATNDGGAGMAAALGYKFLSAEGRELPLGGGALARLERIDATSRDPRLAGVTIEVACDVTNPLCGPTGASAVYGPQKGASAEVVQRLDLALENLARVVQRDLAREIRDISGAGAAGGLGAGLVGFANGRLRRGIDLVIDAVKLRERMARADFCITGEGRIDHSSGYGKTVAGVAHVAREFGKPCVALGGSLSSGAESVLDQGVTAIFSICTEPMNLSHALDAESTRRRLSRTAEQVFRLWYGSSRILTS